MGRGEPIYITAIPWTAERGIGHVRHVRFSNVLCRSENGVFIQGWQPGLVEDILLENVRVELDKWSSWPGGRYDIRPCPPITEGLPQTPGAAQEEGLRQQPTAGFFLQNARDVTLRNCVVVWGEHPPAYFRHALESHAVEGLVVENFKGASAHPEQYPAVLEEKT